MAAENITVFGMYPHQTDFEHALSALHVAGFGDAAILSLSKNYPGLSLISGRVPDLVAVILARIGPGSNLSGLDDALLELGIPEGEAKRYQGRIQNGGILLSVHCGDPDCVTKVKNVLHSTGAENVFP